VRRDTADIATNPVWRPGTGRDRRGRSADSVRTDEDGPHQWFARQPVVSRNPSVRGPASKPEEPHREKGDDQDYQDEHREFLSLRPDSASRRKPVRRSQNGTPVTNH
jgi:hypothetical protein